MEKFQDWIIEEKNVTSGWFSDGKVELEATVYPNIESLYNFLIENHIVKTPYTNIVNWIKYLSFNQHNNYHFLRQPNKEEERDIIILNFVAELSNKETYKTTKKAYAILSISQTGDEFTRDRAMKKIKEWVRDSLPNPRKRLIEHLIRKGVIASGTNIFCEILSKDL